MKILVRYILLVFLGILSLPSRSYAQKPLNAPIDNGPKSRIELLSADSLIGTSGSFQVRTFYGNVKFRHRGVDLYCQQAVHNVGANDIRAYGKITINQGDTLTITGDTLYYDGNTRFAKIFGKKVTLTDDDTKLVSTQVNYNLNTDLAYYPNPGTVTQDSSQLKSNIGYYNTRTKIFNYYGDVEIKTPSSLLCTDSLDYDGNTGLAVFHTYTTITSKDGNLEANKGTYNTRTKKSLFAGRSQVDNEEYYLIADTLDFNNNEQEGYGKGNVIFHSKLENLYMYGDFGEKVKELAYTKMVGNTLTKKIDGKDTLLLAADSVIIYDKKPDFAFPKIDSSLISNSTAKDSTQLYVAGDTLQVPPKVNLFSKSDSISLNTPLAQSDSSATKKFEFIIATGNVKIFRPDFQAKCDSLNYDLVDSLISFFGKPIIWNENSQLLADSINTLLSKNKIKKMDLNRNSFVISQDSVGNFNQIKGRQIEALFDSSTAINRVNVYGNGESIYYALDDLNKIIALNKVICAKMNLNFLNRKVSRIAFIGVPESRFIPPTEIDQEAMRLDNFEWRISEKPTKNEVIGTIFEKIIIDKKEDEKPPNSIP